MRVSLFMGVAGVGALLCVGMLAGCGNPVLRNYKPKAVEISSPPLGTTVTAQVGDSMLMQGSYSETDAIKVTQEIKGYIAWAFYSFTPGYYVKFADDDKGEYFIPEGGPEGGTMRHRAAATDSQSLFIARNGKEACGINLHGDRACTADFEVERTTRRVYLAGSFQKALIYNGLIGNKINIAYRESSNDYAHPAFNNEIGYDLSESKNISYKGAELEILDATNKSITFKVIRNFDSVRRQ